MRGEQEASTTHQHHRMCKSLLCVLPRVRLAVEKRRQAMQARSLLSVGTCLCRSDRLVLSCCGGTRAANGDSLVGCLVFVCMYVCMYVCVCVCVCCCCCCCLLCWMGNTLVVQGSMGTRSMHATAMDPGTGLLWIYGW